MSTEYRLYIFLKKGGGPCPLIVETHTGIYVPWGMCVCSQEPRKSSSRRVSFFIRPKVNEISSNIQVYGTQSSSFFLFYFCYYNILSSAVMYLYSRYSGYRLCIAQGGRPATSGAQCFRFVLALAIISAGIKTPTKSIF
jgi:hypothetical protein